MTWLRRAGIAIGVLGVLLIAIWLARMPLLRLATALYFDAQDISSDVDVQSFDLGGATLRVRLGGADAPAITADSVRVVLGGDGLTPQVTAIVVTQPVIRARMDANGTVTLPALQNWIDRLKKGAQGKSHFVSDDLIVALHGARVLLSTPHGAAEIDGNAEVRRGRLTTAAGQLLPATLRVNGRTLRLAGRASVRANGAFYNARGNFEVSGAGLSVRGTATLAGLSAADHAMRAQSADIAVTQADIETGAFAVKDAVLTLSLRMPSVNVGADGKLDGESDVAASGSAHLPPEKMRALLAPLPGVKDDLLQALVAATGTVSVTLNGHVEARDSVFAMALHQPVRVVGGNGAVLAVSALNVTGLPQGAQGSAGLTLAGPGLPHVALTAQRFDWTPAQSQADLSVSLQGSYGPLRTAAITADGHAALSGNAVRLSLSRCASLRAAQILSGKQVVAANVAARLCPSSAGPVLANDGGSWAVAAHAQDMSAEIIAARIAVSGGSAVVALRDNAGTVSFAATQVVDRTGKRFAPLRTSGSSSLARGVLRGRATVSLAHGNTLLGAAEFTHTMASGAGAAQIHVPKLVFANGKLQPADLAPLRALIQRAEGAVAFEGAVAWSPKGLTSHGELRLQDIGFRTPLGMAHGVNGIIALTSLLPPESAPGQTITVTKVDWTLPLTSLAGRFTFKPDAVTVEAAQTSIAGGTIALDTFILPLYGTTAIRATARLEHIDLADLVAATNMADKVKVAGRVSGTVPFFIEGEDFRVVRGHLHSDGAGRLEVNRTVWTNGEVDSTNSVQDFAYQALEHLAFEALTAQLNSVENGRLSVVFHAVGKSDPPTPQEARIGLFDLINGKAFTKRIDLPSGTPIDLTLDTSLNFDELLRSFKNAWSTSVTPPHASPRGGQK
jgi:hypothetical protein